MLKVTVYETKSRIGRSVRLILKGKLAGAAVDDLEKTWNRVSEKAGAAIAVDLSAVRFISQAGEELLLRLDTKGADLRPGSLPIRAWVAQMRRAAAHPIVLLGLWFAVVGYGQQVSLVERTPQLSGAEPTVSGSAPALAFSRYLASVRERNPFTESGPIGVEIEASLPGLAKEGSMAAVRQTGPSERSEYSAVRFDGDKTVKQQVIARYLAAEEEAEELPYSSVAVTPANYKFRYAGSLETSGTALYIFQIAPKKKRIGLIRGQIWIDSATGVAVHQSGRFVKRPSVFIHQIDVTRDTNLRDGLPYTRVTHVALDTRLVGRAELTITERPLQKADRGTPQVITQIGAR